MVDWFSSMSGLEKVFLGCAVCGGVLFILRLVMQLVGADTDASSAELPDDISEMDPGIGDSDASFRVFTVQGVMAFLMMFGLVGVAVRKTTALSELQAMVIAAVAGVAVMYAQAKLFALLLGLQSSGNIRMDNAVGRQGRVYLTIPPGGTGKAEVSVQGRLRVFDAVSAGGEALATGALVRVSGVRGGDVLVVEKIA